MRRRPAHRCALPSPGAAARGGRDNGSADVGEGAGDGAYARALAERGFAALASDHRTFDESEGEPRQPESPVATVADIRAAVTAFADDPRTRDLPVVAIRVCVGAGYMAKAVADDERFTAFAGVAGYYSDAASAAAARHVDPGQPRRHPSSPPARCRRARTD